MIDISLPEGFEWCRKRKYNVQVELACYPITENQPLIEGFEEKVFNIDRILKKYAINDMNLISLPKKWGSYHQRVI